MAIVSLYALDLIDTYGLTGGNPAPFFRVDMSKLSAGCPNSNIVICGHVVLMYNKT